MNKTHNTLKHQFLGFVITGSISTGIMYLLYLGLNRLINYHWSYAIAYFVSVLILYFLNILLIFKKKFAIKTFLKFPLIYLFQYFIGALSLEFLVRLGVSLTLAPVLIIVILLPVTFILNRVVLMNQIE